MQHPFLGIHTGETVSTLVITVEQPPTDFPAPPATPTTDFERQYAVWYIGKSYAADAPRPTCKMRKDDYHPFDANGTWIKVANLAEAERYYIGLLIADAETIDVSSYTRPATWCGGDGTSPFIMIQRGANLCAARTRRGCGNVSMMNRSTALAIMASTTTSAMRAVSDVSIGGKQVSFIINNSIYVIEDERIPDNVVTVFYKGGVGIDLDIPNKVEEMDAPAHFLTTSTGNYLFMRETFATNELTNWRAFFKTYRFTR